MRDPNASDDERRCRSSRGVHLRSPALAFLALGCGLVGCGPPMKVKGGEANSPTGGIAIIFDERDLDDLRFRHYELDADGTLRLGGGKVARRGDTDVELTPTKQELQAILDAAERASLREGEIACQPVPESDTDPTVTTIEFAWPGGTRRIELVGVCPAIIPLRDAFEQAGLVRFQRHLDALPEAGVQQKK